MKTEKSIYKTKWSFADMYASLNDPKLEKDIAGALKAYQSFARAYTKNKPYLEDAIELKKALDRYYKLWNSYQPLHYLSLMQAVQQNNKTLTAKVVQTENRYDQASILINFFEIELGKVATEKQKEFLKSPELEEYKVALQRIFKSAKYALSEKEENVIALTKSSGYSMWVQANTKLLSNISITFNQEEIPLTSAVGLVPSLSLKIRRSLWTSIVKELRTHSDLAEAELNAIITRKHTLDALRGFKKPYSSTVLGYQNTDSEIEALTEAVVKSNKTAQNFYTLKAQLLGQESLTYADRSASIGEINKEFTFDGCVDITRAMLSGLDEEFVDIFDTMLTSGRFDVFPTTGKIGSQFCSSLPASPTHIQLNHIGSYDSLTTLVHEMGHAIHAELSRKQPVQYEGHPISTAEVASTLFENLLFDHMFDQLSEKEQTVALHNRLQRDVSSIHRQIALFNFETELHEQVKSEGYVPKEHIAEMMNNHMSAYLGKSVVLTEDDGYFFADWPHIRNFFYVYAYAYGQIISNALYSQYQTDKGYLEKIKTFLSAGQSKDPKDIFSSIGIKTTQADFWTLGLDRIDSDLKALKKRVKKFII